MRKLTVSVKYVLSGKLYISNNFFAAFMLSRILTPNGQRLSHILHHMHSPA